MKIKLLAVIGMISLGLLTGCTTTGNRCCPSNTNYQWQPCMNQSTCTSCTKNYFVPASCVNTNCSSCNSGCSSCGNAM